MSCSATERTLPEKLARDVWPTSQIPCPIYDQNLQILPAYLRPDQKFETQCVTIVARIVQGCI